MSQCHIHYTKKGYGPSQLLYVIIRQLKILPLRLYGSGKHIWKGKRFFLLLIKFFRCVVTIKFKITFYSEIMVQFLSLCVICLLCFIVNKMYFVCILTRSFISCTFYTDTILCQCN